MTASHFRGSGSGRLGADVTPARFVQLVAGGTATCLLAIVGLNALVDPLWLFPSFYSPLNGARTTFNERQMKVNRALFGGVPEDAVLIGSSRCTYLDSRDPAAMPFYNFAASSLAPDEYLGYLQFAEQRHGQPFEAILLGLDFFGSRVRLSAAEAGASFEPPESYIREASAPFYRAKTLLSGRLLLRSAQALKFSSEIALGRPKPSYYARETHRTGAPPSASMLAAERAENVEQYRRLYRGLYRYDPELRERLAAVKAAFPRSRFYTFTTPEADVLFEEMVRAGRLPDYERWLGDLVAVFGEVVDYGGLNSVAREPSAFLDAHHPARRTATWMLHGALGKLDADHPADFGVMLSSATLTSRIAQIRRQAAKVLSQPAE